MVKEAKINGQPIAKVFRKLLDGKILSEFQNMPFNLKMVHRKRQMILNGLTEEREGGTQVIKTVQR